MPVADALIGSRVGPYRLERVIGQGGMGRVYAAANELAGSRVAIKVLTEAYVDNPGLLDRFFTEARAVNLVAHENIASVLDLDRLPDGRPYIVMELIEGKSLRDVVREGGVTTPLGGVVKLMIEVLAALEAAHAIGIVHRDLKPDNVLVTVRGHAKVLDFGIAKLTQAPPGAVIPKTATGIVLGTPEYMAPEQIESGTPDARTDVYAVGVMLYELVTGERPFGGTDWDVMRAHLDQPPPPPRRIRGELPQALEDVIMKSLAKAPDDRYATAADMAKALRRSAATLGPGALKPLAGTWLSPIAPGTLAGAPASVPRRRSRPLVVLAVGAIAASAIGIGVGVGVSRGDDVEHVAAAVPPRVTPAPVPALPDASTLTIVTPVRGPSYNPRQPLYYIPPVDDTAVAPAPPAAPAAPPASPASPVPPAAPAPVDPSFDWFANAVRAQQELTEDRHGIERPVLTGITLDPVFPDGTFRQGEPGATATYRFSDAMPHRGDDCSALVILGGTVPDVRVVTGPCGASPLVAPRCTLADVRAKASAVSLDTERERAAITLDARGWTYRTKTVETTFADDCL